MAQYTLTLKSKNDYRIIKKILKAFDGAKIIPARDAHYTLDDALEEVREGKIVGPFNSVGDFMKDLLS